ncbi:MULTISPECIES: hypothetical protein [Kitasatospora]|uniref:Uncharacterized protein n=1 Tax=Kitasatospora setae (strain ATCC 33774 / DSM 43861 / JCM 3304 / KCC A-0304 / NBRC 14216 / KM-6054) TaxID=452652 RepID=E4N5X3_KITSK|nr:MULTISPECIES: hypothetical protein [Kitasatospora]BAJ26604.1 hypothetical protein KSE_07640 [Kitasatospora setae KM-6054]
MRIRTAAKAATTLAVAGGLALGLPGAAFAVPDGPTSLTGKGCPSSYVNYANGGTWTQTLTKKFVAPNGFQYGDYKVTFRTSAGTLVNEGTREYRCY